MAELTTQYAPAERAGAEELAKDHEALMKPLVSRKLLDSFPEPAVVLNRQRQIVMANDKLEKMLGKDAGKLVGLRPGEALNCVHANDCEGCGTAEFCRNCGAVRAIWKSQVTRKVDVQECRLTYRTAEGTASLDLRVWATPVPELGDYTVFAVRDTTDEKRRRVLERIFFHDVLNAAGALQGMMKMIGEEDGEEWNRGDMDIARHLAEEVIAEISAQRDLLAAERGELPAALQTIDAGELLKRLCVGYAHHSVAQDKKLAEPAVQGDTRIRTSENVLFRTLGNLVKNALEASAAGQVVRTGFTNDGKTAEFWVNNETVMPRNVQLQVFQRSFSTKEGTGRGVGTYSVKLLTERYLKGNVEFSSQEGKGTTFWVRLPGKV